MYSLLLFCLRETPSSSRRYILFLVEMEGQGEVASFVLRFSIFDPCLS